MGRKITAVGAEWLRGTPRSPNNVTSPFFNTVYVLPKDLRFEHGGAKLPSCPRRHLTALRPWPYTHATAYICSITLSFGQDSDARLFCNNRQVNLKNKPKIGNLIEKVQHVLDGNLNETTN